MFIPIAKHLDFLKTLFYGTRNKFADAKDILFTDCARSAILSYLLKEKNIHKKKLFVPKFICPDLLDSLKKHITNLYFYDIDAQFKPLFAEDICKIFIILFSLNDYNVE